VEQAKLEIRPGYKEDYRKRHDEIWQEMLGTLRRAGISSYNIVRHGLTLDGYLGTDDLEATKRHLAGWPVNRNSGQSMGRS